MEFVSITFEYLNILLGFQCFPELDLEYLLILVSVFRYTCFSQMFWQPSFSRKEELSQLRIGYMFNTSDMTQAPNKLLIISPQTYKDVVLCGLKVIHRMGEICVETQCYRNFMYADHVRLGVRRALPPIHLFAQGSTEFKYANRSRKTSWMVSSRQVSSFI